MTTTNELQDLVDDSHLFAKACDDLCNRVSLQLNGSYTFIVLAVLSKLLVNAACEETDQKIAKLNMHLAICNFATLCIDAGYSADEIARLAKDMEKNPPEQVCQQVIH